MAQMSYCIGCRCGTDIATLDISDHNQAFGFTVINCFLECLKSFNSKLLIHCDLRFYCRDQIICCIYNSFIILPDCLSCAFQCLTEFCKSFLLDMLRNIIQHRIQSYNDRCVCFADVTDQFVNHDYFSSWFLNTIFPSQIV